MALIKQTVNILEGTPVAVAEELSVTAKHYLLWPSLNEYKIDLAHKLSIKG